MGPLLLVDKSTLQTLSLDEAEELFSHFWVVVPPILLYEMVGDLSKPHKRGPDPTAIVVRLAQKIMNGGGILNAERRTICESELMGHVIDMKRPIKGGGIHVRDSTGNVGLIFDESEDARAVRHWAAGQFTKEDREMADFWRGNLGELNLEQAAKDLRQRLRGDLKADSLSQAARIARRILGSQDPKISAGALEDVLHNLRLTSAFSESVRSRWTAAGRPCLGKFAPFTAHCYKCKLIFLIGLRSGLIGTRASNVIDMEYLCYSPFCQAFASGDNLHVELAPVLLRDNQMFVSRDDLRSDLEERIGSAAIKTTGTPEQGEKKALRDGSGRSGSVIEKVWMRFAGQPGPSPPKPLSKDAEAALLERAKPMLDAIRRHEEQKAAQGRSRTSERM